MHLTTNGGGEILSANQIASPLVLLLILGFAALEDKQEKRVSNRLIVLGISLCFLMAWGGYLGVTFLVVLRNILIPVISLYLLFLVGVIGAGDIKLFSLIGGYMGLTFAKNAIVLSFAIGAGWSLIWLLSNHLLFPKMAAVVAYFGDLKNGKFKTYQSDSTFAFSLCIFAATSALMVKNGLEGVWIG